MNDHELNTTAETSERKYLPR